MATAKKAPVRKTAARKAPAKKAPARKAAPKAAARKAPAFDLKHSAEKAVNVYLGVLGMGYDRFQENMETVRKENDKRIKKLESRGAKLRKELRTNIDKIEAPELDDVKEQFSKLQDQLEDVVENMKERLTTAKAA